MKRLLLLLSLIVCAVGQAQTIGSGVTVGSGVMIGGITGGGVTTGCLFSPVAGHYTTAQSVAVSCIPSAGTGTFYSLDGSTPTLASPQYSSPLSISANTTINVLSESIGTVGQNTGTSSAKWKCTVASPGAIYGSLACGSGGGVGSNLPSNVTWTWNGAGGVMQERVNTTAPTGETQVLYIWTGTACDNCTKIAEDKWIQAVGDQTIIANNEMDVFLNDSFRNTITMLGLQCNQQPGNSGYQHWQIDTTGGWSNTSVTTACPISTTNWTHVILEGHRILGDTACGGSACTYFDALTISTCNVAPVAPGVCPAGHVVIAPFRNVLNITRTSYSVPAGWSSYCGFQDQIDLTNTATSSPNPTNGGRNVMFANVTCGFGANSTGSATYTIP